MLPWIGRSGTRVRSSCRLRHRDDDTQRWAVLASLLEQRPHRSGRRIRPRPSYVAGPHRPRHPDDRAQSLCNFVATLDCAKERLPGRVDLLGCGDRLLRGRPQARPSSRLRGGRPQHERLSRHARLRRDAPATAPQLGPRLLRAPLPASSGRRPGRRLRARTRRDARTPLLALRSPPGPAGRPGRCVPAPRLRVPEAGRARPSPCSARCSQPAWSTVWRSVRVPRLGRRL
jgi:hypothetical protein